MYGLVRYDTPPTGGYWTGCRYGLMIYTIINHKPAAVHDNPARGRNPTTTKADSDLMRRVRVRVSALGVSHVMRYINAQYLLTYLELGFCSQGKG